MDDQYHYIPINPGTKRPILEFGGWPIDSTHDNVFSLSDVEEADHEWWAIVGHESGDLLVIDVDLYKMEDDVISEVNRGWFGILDDTKIVKTPSGGLHVYIRTDCELDDLPRPVDGVDLKGDVAQGYVLSHPKDKYNVVNDCEVVKTSSALVRELPVFAESRPRGSSEPAEPIVSEDEMRMKTAPPCLGVALNSDDSFAKRLIDSVKYGTVDKLPVHRVLNQASFPEGENRAAPNFLHDKPSKTGTNFRVDEGAETFRCWRHDVTGNAYHLIAVKYGYYECGDWASGNVNMADVKRRARKEGFLTEDDVITCQTVKDNDMCPFDCGRRHPFEGVIS